MVFRRHRYLLDAKLPARNTRASSKDFGAFCIYVKSLFFIYTVKPVLSGHSQRRPKIGIEDILSLNEGQKVCRML